MSNPPTPQPPKFPRVSPALVGAGVLVIAMGFGLPMLAPGTAPAPDPIPRDTGAKQPAPAPIQPPSAGGLVTSLLRLAVGLVVVCGLCVLVARLIGPKPPPAPGAMDVVASIVVAPCVLHLVRAGDRRLLIGTDLAGVKAVLELPGPVPEIPAAPPAPVEQSAPVPNSARTREEILSLLLRPRARTDAPSPG